MFTFREQSDFDCEQVQQQTCQTELKYVQVVRLSEITPYVNGNWKYLTLRCNRCRLFGSNGHWSLGHTHRRMSWHNRGTLHHWHKAETRIRLSPSHSWCPCTQPDIGISRYRGHQCTFHRSDMRLSIRSSTSMEYTSQVSKWVKGWFIQGIIIEPLSHLMLQYIENGCALTLWCLLLPYGHSYKASCDMPG